MQSNSVIVPDGHQYGGQRDPPGQYAFYIPPGDTKRESYRRVTYRKFPETAPISPASLSQSGFFYTGYKDRVKCFSCASTVENWEVGDDPSDPRWHRHDCDFANGRDQTNEPLLAAYRRLLTLNAQSPSFQLRNIAINGGNYTQQSIFPARVHGATNAPISHETSTNVTVTTQNQPERRGEWESEYPCLHPVNPHMRSLQARLDTFKTTATRRWPREKLQASPEEIAEAGFYSLGERDRVKCWYCNGGLQNWDYDDDPFTEHAKWFPSCEFVKNRKGPAFVEELVTQFPNLNRPIPTVRTAPQSIPPEIPRTAETPDDQSIVQQTKDMGFSEEEIRTVMRRQHEATGRQFETVNDLVEALTAYQQNEEHSSAIETPPSPVPSSSSRSSPTLSSPTPSSTTPSSVTEPQRPSELQSLTAEQGSQGSLLSELRSLEESRTCKACHTRTSNVVLIPCGHLASCTECSENLRRCPLCHKTITDKIRAYRS